ncbi:uncharacterized protein J4E84_000884 [Alternaria hordeiaustralica]|uniref:uncharacterized protein n=1 Tax=Alternaria hordeiaustralica TaxID=1187925 RepID=UPI0020C44B1A|nr:uncharacterized protein J4E84_000884 [Alternaria hordeiaustralica]KAI4697751.1 hypothetical protein J4E84_000884 [Alternaria hordeiaustralica]
MSPAEVEAKLAEVKEQMGRLERSLEEDVARKTEINLRNTASFSRVGTLPGQEQSSDQEDDEDTKDLRPTHLVTEDAAYYEPDDDVNDDMVDLGFRMGRVRITERIGGLVRPRLSDELATTLKELPDRETPSLSAIEEDAVNWLAPTQDYVAPSSNFVLASGIDQTALESHLPARVVVDKLLSQYWVAVHTIARTVHRPSFERQYQNFWIRVNMGMEPRASFQAVLFAALLNSVVSMTDDMVQVEFGVEKQNMIDSFREGTEAALARANFLRTTKLETIQAFVMYLIPLCRNEVSRAHSALTGSLIRLAECMGLHRDPTTYSSSPVEIQVRRLIWYQICFLDLRTCEAVGPRPQIRLDDYDTRFPLNIDDVDLDRAERGEGGIDVSKDRNHFTDMTISLMRFEGYEMHRFLWTERPKLDRKRADGKSEVTITSLLSRVQSFQAAMEKKYLPMLSKTELLHVLASELYGIVSNRLYISILQKYITSARSRMPERLRQLTLSAATMILEHGMAIEQHPVLSSWAWIVGALHQHHCALLLVSEIYVANPEPAMEQRIWKCLDYSFNLPTGLSNVEKTRMVLEELVGKTKAYSALKRVRVPADMPQAGLEPRQRVQRKEGGRDGSTQFEPSTSGPLSHLLNGNANLQNLVPPSPSPPQTSQVQSTLVPRLNTFPGAMPTVDWGTIDMPATVSVSTYDVIPGNSPSNLMPTTAQQGESSNSSPNSTMYEGGMTAGSNGNTAMDAINDIDWNDIEEMFGDAEMGAGNMLIPPFAFPSFSASNLQWPASGRMQ